MKTSWLLICTLMLLLAIPSLQAQEFRASISGTILDPSGAAVPGAQVTALNMTTSIRTSAQSGAAGTFAMPQLQPGDYELTVESPGFRTFTRKGISLAVGERANLEVRLEIGSQTETVTVSAELTAIESDQSIMGQLMDNKKISELPLNGRQAFMLLQLSAGVIFTQQFFGPGGFSGTRAYDVNGQFSMHGSRSNTNSFLMDGAPLGANGQFSYVPLVDSVEEFKVSTPVNDASQGLTGGGVVNMSMKSGGNEFHGTISHFIRNHIFDARTTQQNRAAASSPYLGAKQHQWNNSSVAVTGPIIKNRFFFSGSYEGFWDRVPRPTTQTVATLLQRQGDFSQTFNSAGQLMTIYDPLSTRQEGSKFVRDAFPNNRIPDSRIVPVAKAILGYVPAPNLVTNAITNFNNYAGSPNVSKFAYNSWFMKFDYSWNALHRTFVSETQNYGSNYANNNGMPFGNPIRTGSDPRRRNHYGATVDHLYTMNSRTVMNARVSWDRFLSYLRNSSIDDLDATDLGFKGRTGSYPEPRFPAIRFDDYVELANASKDYSPDDVFSAVVSFSHIKGSHFLKWGTRMGQVRMSRNVTGEWFGRFNFSKGWTQRDPQRSDTTSGNDIASFLLGFPASGGTDTNPQSSVENKFVGLYFQDDIKVTRKLTVNLGLRWDVQTSPTERFNRSIIAFDPSLAYQLGSATAKGGLVFADDSHRQPWKTNWRDFQPRLGIAYRLQSRMVWRAGYGISYLPLNGTGGNGQVLQTGYSRRTPFVATTGGGINSYIPGRPGTGIFENPFPNGILEPYGSALGPKTQLGQAVSFADVNYEVPRVHQFNVGFELDLPWNSVLEASYVGSRTRKFAVSKSLSAIPLEERLKGLADPNYLNAAVSNPFAGAPELVGTSLYAATITRAQSLSPFPQFGSVTMTNTSRGYTSYNALQVRLNRRFSGGFTAMASYTFSKNIEATSYQEPQYDFLERVIAADDRTHRLSVSGLIKFPFGRGERFGANWNSGLNAIAGNWQYNFIVDQMSGTPTAMPDAIAVSDPRLPNGPAFNRWFNTCTLLANGTRSKCASADEPVAWQQLKPNQLRLSSTRFPNLRNHWKTQINMSIFKVFPITEKINLEFRGEAFNAFNTPIYQGPNTSLTSANFGIVVLDQQNFPRSMQFAMRLRF